MNTTRPNIPQLLREYRLWVYPETQGQPWHATLEKVDQSERLEFDSPLELARHLANLTHPTWAAAVKLYTHSGSIVHF